MDRDWDTLVLLDGCRYDMFEELHPFKGRLERVSSRASESLTFMRENFFGRTLHDTVYVTANPYATELPDGTFHDVITLATSEWDEDLRTVPPEAVAEAAVEAYERYPNKRLVAHFMQPHYPFIGETGDEISHHGIRDETQEIAGTGHVWKRLRYGLEDVDRVRAAYYENLELVFPSVERIHREVPGKTVVSADHGNLLGERLRPVPVRGYGHPPDLLVPELVEVPWLELEGGVRRETTAAPPVERERAGSSDEVVRQRLRDLGYA
jgi:hypothetical protein